jgi:protein TonB
MTHRLIRTLLGTPLRCAGICASITALVAGCASKPPAPPPPPAPAPVVVVTPAPIVLAPAPAFTGKTSGARNPRDYRKDAASHLYAANSSRIFKGKMPPLLHAVGVLQVNIDGRGNVTGLSWMRAPSHAPDVMAEIERSVRRAAPYPAPIQLGAVTYTDTWLWHKSGRFQLDTLTEGQL